MTFNKFELIGPIIDILTLLTLVAKLTKKYFSEK